MIFRDKSIFAIEIYHQPLNNNSFYMCGRMCIYLFNKIFGDINNEYCHLYSAYSALLDKINNINLLEYEFGLSNDYEVFNFLDDKLYMAPDERTLEQIKIDARLYFKFDFMTNTGEIFDRTKSFIYMDKNKKIHIIYRTDEYNDGFEDGKIICNELDKEIFENVTKDLIKWYDELDNRKNN
jgi:hypothetical protein